MHVEFLDKSLYFMTIKTATEGGISISSDVLILSKLADEKCTQEAHFSSQHCKQAKEHF